MSEEINTLIQKMITKIDSLVPYLEDSEEILLASKTLQELVKVESDKTDIDAIKNEITKLDKKITDLSVELKAKDSKLELDINTANVSISNNSDDILRNTGAINSLESNFSVHINDHDNPHGVTKAQVGLEFVPNYTATSNVENTDKTKFATAFAVNTVWNKAKIHDTQIQNLVDKIAVIETEVDKIAVIETELPNFYRKTGGIISGNVKVVGNINASSNIKGFDRTVVTKDIKNIENQVKTNSSSIKSLENDSGSGGGGGGGEVTIVYQDKMGNMFHQLGWEFITLKKPTAGFYSVSILSHETGETYDASFTITKDIEDPAKVDSFYFEVNYSFNPSKIFTVTKDLLKTNDTPDKIMLITYLPVIVGEF